MWKINAKDNNFLQKTETEFIESKFKSSNPKVKEENNKISSPQKQNDIFGVTFNSLDPNFKKVVVNAQKEKPLVKSDNAKIIIKTKHRNLKGMK